MSDSKTKLSIEEFLAINEDYNTYKATVKKTESRNTALGMIVLLASLFAFGVIFFVTFNVILALIITLVTLIPSIVFLNSNEKKAKKKIEKCGADLYREYLEENNFI